MTERPGDLPAGFRAAGVACGLKPSGGLDLGLLVCSAPECVSAARFTRSGVLAAPVVLTQQRSRLDALRVVVANSGNANAATGNRGFEEAAKMQGAASMAGGVREDQVAVASTGVIGVPLDSSLAIRGIARARSELREYGHGDFSEAIRTTDKFAKEVEVDVALPSGTVRLTAQAKGAGMISPAFATMLCFVQTDAELSAETADLLLGVCVARSFDRVCVDGQLSTNDTAILQASGSSGVVVAPQSEDEARFGEALDWALRKLALDIVRDGEGSKRIGRVVVAGATTRSSAASRGRSRTRRWSRPRCTVGTRTGAGSRRPSARRSSTPRRWRWTSRSRACRSAPRARRRATTWPLWPRRSRATRSSTTVGLPGDGAEVEVFFSDLSHEYVTINADYTT